MPRDAFWFAVTNEAREFARQGHYSRLWFDVRESDFGNRDSGKNGAGICSDEGVRSGVGTRSIMPVRDILGKRYVVVHLRNKIGDPKKDEKKNIKPHYVFAIFKLLQNRFKAGLIDGVVIVGNDAVDGLEVDTIEKIIDDSLPIIDFRNSEFGIRGSGKEKEDERLKILAGICKNAVMTIGRDSGIIHLAGAAGCPKLVSWDFVIEGWFPKVPDGVLSAWVKKESTIDRVLESINLGIG